MTTASRIRLASRGDLADLTALQTALADEMGTKALSSDELDRLALCGPGARALVARDAQGRAQPPSRAGRDGHAQHQCGVYAGRRREHDGGQGEGDKALFDGHEWLGARENRREV